MILLGRRLKTYYTRFLKVCHSTTAASKLQDIFPSAPISVGVYGYSVATDVQSVILYLI